MKKRIQSRLEREFKDYKDKVLALTRQEIFNKAWETAVKQEISLFFVKRTEDNRVLEVLDKFLVTEVLLDYLYGLWLNADSGTDDEIFDTLEVEIIACVE